MFGILAFVEGNMRLNRYIADLLEERETAVCEPSVARVVEDELFRAFAEKVAEDDKPKREPTLEEHDKQHHPDGFDPKTDTCKFREKMKEKDSVDLIYATSDVHQTGIEGITDTECGTIVLAGDFMERAKLEEDFEDAAKWWDEKFLPWCEEHKGQQIVIIGGNCDKWLYNNRDKVEWPANVHYLDDTSAEVNGMKVYGTSWCPHNMNGAWEVDDEQLEKEFAKIPEGLDILVTHVPPKGEGLSLDRDDKNNGNFGSEALTKAILEKKPKIVLCGHIHRGSHKPVKIGDSLVMNVSRVSGDDRYEQGFHGRKIGVERTENGIGFLIDEGDEGKISLGKKSAVPKSIIKLRDALRKMAMKIGRHIRKPEKYDKPEQSAIVKVEQLILLAKKDLKGFVHPKRKMMKRLIEAYKKSKASGFEKEMPRVGKLWDGDPNGVEIPSYSFSWGGSFGGGKVVGLSDWWKDWGTSGSGGHTGHTSHTSGESKYNPDGTLETQGSTGWVVKPYHEAEVKPTLEGGEGGGKTPTWNSGMSIDEILAKYGK